MEKSLVKERLESYGRQYLTDTDLMTIITGDRESATLALKQSDHDLIELGKKSIAELCQIPGIGKGKAAIIIAAMEISRRRRCSEIRDKISVRSSRDAFQVLQGILEDLPHEEFWVLLLNRANRIISREQISSGSIAGTVVDPKMIFKAALEKRASGIIMAHNHPSGKAFPSQADIDLTRKLKDGGKLLDIIVADHIIVGDGQYYSFADEGMI